MDIFSTYWFKIRYKLLLATRTIIDPKTQQNIVRNIKSIDAIIDRHINKNNL